MRYSNLLEAVDTTDIYHKGREALLKSMRAYLRGLWDAFPDIEGAVHDKYDAFYRTQRDNDRHFVIILLNHASQALSVVTKEALRARFGKYVEIDQTSYYTPSTMTFVSASQFTDDEMSNTARGYFQSQNAAGMIVKVFVDADVVFAAAMDMISEIITGDSENPDAVVDVIMPIYVHEFVHLINHLSGGHRMKRDHGYTSVPPGRDGDPYRRNPERSHADMLRYRGSSDEIASFANEAAAEIYQELGRHSRRGVDNSAIDYALKDLVMGYAASRTATTYFDLAYGVFQGFYEQTGVDHGEMRIVLKRFLKLTYQALWRYKKDVGGKHHQPGIGYGDVPPEWVAAAKKGLAYAAAFITQQIANDLAFGAQPYENADTLLRWGGPQMWEGPLFLERYFLNDEWDDAKSAKLKAAFDKMLRSRLETALAAKQAAA